VIVLFHRIVSILLNDVGEGKRGKGEKRESEATAKPWKKKTKRERKKKV